MLVEVSALNNGLLDLEGIEGGLEVAESLVLLALLELAELLWHGLELLGVGDFVVVRLHNSVFYVGQILGVGNRGRYGGI